MMRSKPFVHVEAGETFERAEERMLEKGYFEKLH